MWQIRFRPSRLGYWLFIWCFTGQLSFALASGTLLVGNGGYPKPTGRFEVDTFRIGRPITYSLSIRHKADQQIVFPDTSFNAFPFSIESRTYFNTVSNNGISLDSVVYRLVSYSIAPLQQVSIPVWYISGADSVPVYPLSNSSAKLLSVLPQNPKSELTLKAVDKPALVPEILNTTYLLVALAGGGLLIFLLNVFAGKPIQRVLKRLLLFRRHKLFIGLIDRLESQTLRESSSGKMESALALWKKHLERLSEKPFSTYTSKEIIVALEDDDALVQVLQSIDRWVYGGLKPTEIKSMFLKLKDVAQGVYETKQNTLKNG